MSNRTTAAAVAKVVEVDSRSWPDIEPFIEAANALVTAKCTASGYSDAILELIERWLAAHFYRVADPQPTMEVAGSVTAQYESRVDLGFDVTKYGQQAMRLDYAGNLALMNNAMKKQEGTLAGTGRVGVSYVGREPTTPNTYPRRCC